MKDIENLSGEELRRALKEALLQLTESQVEYILKKIPDVLGHK